MDTSTAGKWLIGAGAAFLVLWLNNNRFGYSRHHFRDPLVATPDRRYSTFDSWQK